MADEPRPRCQPEKAVTLPAAVEHQLDPELLLPADRCKFDQTNFELSLIRVSGGFYMSIRFPSVSYAFLFFGLVGAVTFWDSEPLAAQQESSLQSSVSGVISCEGGGSLNGFQVEVNERPGRASAWADVRLDGTFEVRTPGSADQHYLLRIRNQRGRIVHEDTVQPLASPLEIHLAAPNNERPITGVVSAQELLNPVPQKAKREYERAKKAVGKGDIQRAIDHLHKAIQIAPQFAEAHNSLGVKYMLLQDYAQAAAAFEEAVRLKPDSGEPHSNLGVALHGLKRYAEAEQQIRLALGIDPQAAKTRFALALVLSSQTDREEEALGILAQVADQIPEAHIYAAYILSHRADRRAVVREVRAYLDSGEQKHREMAESWLRSLRSGVALSGNLGMD
jgi:tetratricopeptide (TPR) repeat protein